MLDNYPELRLSDGLLSLLNSNTPFGFLMNLLALLGLSPKDILNWCAKILCGQEVLRVDKDTAEKIGEKLNKVSEGADNKAAQGVLDVIEEAVKLLLLSNVKDLFTCSLNPLIPNDILRYPRVDDDNSSVTLQGSKGIEISIPVIDMFNILNHAPSSAYGKALYFDNNRSALDMWKSTDFNAFLWYVINKGDSTKPDDLKLIWDNRVKRRKELEQNEIFSKNFYNINAGNGSFISKSENNQKFDKYTVNEKDKEKKKNSDTLIKNQYLIINYEERSATNPVPDILKIWLDADRYRRAIKVNVNDISRTVYVNKTVFEFNYDYIYSLKLFDSKTLVAHVVNSLLGVLNSSVALGLNVKYSTQQDVVAGKVGEIVTQLMNGEDEVINDCFFSFSNEEYDRLLTETERKHSENYTFGEVSGSLNNLDINSIVNDINSIGDSATLEEEQTRIANVFTTVADAVAAENGMVSSSDKLSFSANIIFDLVKISVTEIVMQVLSPKVMLLYAINSYFMGDATDGDFSKINIDNFIKGLTNLISTIAKQVFDMIMQELMKFLMEIIQELISLMIYKLLLEKIMYYIEILKRLLALIAMFSGSLKGPGSNAEPDTIIDNVSYADIIPEVNKPEDKENC